MSARVALKLLLVVALGVACGSEEVEHHATPVDARLVVAGGAPTQTITFSAGQTVRVEVQFLAGDGDVIAGLETEHFTSVTFDPAALATVAPVSGEPFMFDVTAQATSASGTVTVGFGHDAAADENAFGPFTVTVS
jgi:hypothetical protein